MAGADSADVGRRVLEALAAGRARQLAARRLQAAELRDLVERAARIDRAEGKPERGRAGRITRRLTLAGVPITERWTRKIISELLSDSSASAA